MVGKDKITIADHPKIAFPFTRYGAILLMDENGLEHAFERKPFSYIVIDLELFLREVNQIRISR